MCVFSAGVKSGKASTLCFITYLQMDVVLGCIITVHGFAAELLGSLVRSIKCGTICLRLMGGETCTFNRTFLYCQAGHGCTARQDMVCHGTTRLRSLAGLGGGTIVSCPVRLFNLLHQPACMCVVACGKVS
jgi:hypothetical protein